MVKKITKDGWTLEHDYGLDFLGLNRNRFRMFNEETRTYYPFIGRIRLSNLTRESVVEGDDVSPYTEEEYWEMFEEQKAKYETKKK